MIKSYFFILFAVAVLLVSCQEKSNESKQALVFKYNESANITSLDPAFAKTQSNIWVCNQLFSGLVQLNDSLKIQPDVAKNYTISADGKTYTFILRTDVYFHQNQIFGKALTRKVDAHDFEFSFKRLTDEKIASPGGWILQQVDSFKAVNDTVFQIQLKQSFPAFYLLQSSSVLHFLFRLLKMKFMRNTILKLLRWGRWKNSINTYFNNTTGNPQIHLLF